MKTVALIGSTFTGNHGAEAMVTATVSRIQERVADVRFVLYSYYPARDRAVNRRPNVVVHDGRPLALVLVYLPFAMLLAVARCSGLGRRCLRWVPRSVRELAGASVLLDTAGISFSDGRERFLPFNVCTLLPALLLKVPVIKLSQAVGPFRNPLNKLCAVWTLRRCRAIYARGAATLENLLSVPALAGRAKLAPDVAFLLQDQDCISEEGMADSTRLAGDLAPTQRQHQPTVGICPSAVVARKAARLGVSYESFLADLCHELANAGYRIVVVPNATRSGHKGEHNNDLPVIARVRAGLSRRLPGMAGVFIVDYDICASGIRRLLAACDAVVVSRFHAMVFALTAGIAPAVIGWGHKYREVMDQFGLGNCVVDYASVSVAEARQLIERIVSERQTMQPGVRKALIRVRENAMGQIEDVCVMLRGKDKR